MLLAEQDNLPRIIPPVKNDHSPLVFRADLKPTTNLTNACRHFETPTFPDLNV